jgi:hypothetical protein
MDYTIVTLQGSTTLLDILDLVTLLTKEYSILQYILKDRLLL